MSDNYTAGFNAGERFAYAHRSEPERMFRPKRQRSEYDRGWWDGYCPRSPGWDRSARAPVESDEDVVQEVERG